MDDAAWQAIAGDLKANDAEELLVHIPRHLVDAAAAEDENHPLARLFLSPKASRARLTAKAVKNIVSWLETERGKASDAWWNSRLKLLGSDDAAGTLAEIRALGVALPNNHSTIGDGLKIAPYSAAGRASDFRIRSGAG